MASQDNTSAQELTASAVPPMRIQCVNSCPVQSEADYVLYWMVSCRRPHWNYGLDRAVDWCRELNRPLLVVEALRCDYPWASDRLHQFVLQGMADNRGVFQENGVRCYSYVEREPGAGAGLIESLAERAAVVVTDDFPCFFLPKMVQSLADRIAVRCEAVDGNGLLPMRAADRVFSRAFDFRRWLQKHLHPWLVEFPQAEPLQYLPEQRAKIPRSVLQRWPEASKAEFSDLPKLTAALPIDHSVGPAEMTGGWRSASRVLRRFFESRFSRYAESRNDPADEVASGFSPYLHFGHLSTHQIFDQLIHQEQWSQDDLAERGRGAREGWWGMSQAAESFLDELITWRELGYNMCWQRDDYMKYESLPEWAQQTLGQHASDLRPYLYDVGELQDAQTHDPLWNAAQRQLVRDGRIHNYLRMLWGKKILEWSPSPQEALATMIELNNRYAVDGRNPNSYSGIFWVLGRYDRAWGPERPIFGKVRYMSSENTARKLNVRSYLLQHAEGAERPDLLLQN